MKTDKNGVDFYKASFQEKHTFIMNENTNKLTIKVYGTLAGKSNQCNEIATSNTLSPRATERLIVSVK